MRHPLAFLTCLILALPALPMFGQEEAKQSLTGTWQFDAAKSDVKSKVAATWVIEETDNSIHITQPENGKSKKVEVQCTTDGKECSVNGDKARASFWYSGAVLIEMETKGDRVTRYRMTVSPDGKTLTVQLTHIVPQDNKIESLVFTKS
jgi:hypothetical protein